MTKTTSLVLALALFVNEYTIFYNVPVLNHRYFASNLVYLMGVCLVLKRVNIIPNILWARLSMVCYASEIFSTLTLLECSLVYLWNPVQDYLLYHADDLLLQLSEHQSLDWLVCQLCCGKQNCSGLFSEFLLKAASFVTLVAACSFASK